MIDSSGDAPFTLEESANLHPTTNQHFAESRLHIFITPKMLAARYLLLYNVIMTAGWFIVLFRLVRAVIFQTDVYTTVDIPLKIFQTGAVLEVIHSLTGLVRSSVATTLLQVSSRLFVVWCLLDAIQPVRTCLSLTPMVLAWSLTEIPRYFYFSISAWHSPVPYWLTFIRYSTFLPLYPMGASSEWFTLYSSLDHIYNSRLFSVTMPNRFNFAFDSYTCAILILIAYIPGLPYMYSHMLRQRRKYVTQPLKIVKPE